MGRVEGAFGIVTGLVIWLGRTRLSKDLEGWYILGYFSRGVAVSAWAE